MQETENCRQVLLDQLFHEQDRLEEIMQHKTQEKDIGILLEFSLVNLDQMMNLNEEFPKDLEHL